MPYARPVRQIKSKPVTRGPAVRPGGGAGSSTLYQEGAPGPKKTAPVDPNAGIGAGQGTGAGAGGGANLGAAVQKLAASPTFQAKVMNSGGGPQVQGAPAKPAWQQLQELGIGGQGSAQANQAMLAAEQAKRVPVPVTNNMVTTPQVAGPETQTNTSMLSFPPPAAGPGAEQQPINLGAPGPGASFDPRVANSAAGGFRGPDLFGGGDPGVRARLKQGLMQQQARPASPLGGNPDAPGAVDGGMGAGSSGDFSAFMRPQPRFGRVPGIQQAR